MHPCSRLFPGADVRECCNPGKSLVAGLNGFAQLGLGQELYNNYQRLQEYSQVYLLATCFLMVFVGSSQCYK